MLDRASKPEAAQPLTGALSAPELSRRKARRGEDPREGHMVDEVKAEG